MSLLRRNPHYFVHGNLVFVAGPEDAWAVYRLDGQSYPGLSASRKIELKERIEGFAYAVETDFQLMRVAREWSAQRYAERALATVDPKRGNVERFREVIDAHRTQLAGERVVRPEIYMCVRLGPPVRGSVGMERLGEVWRSLERALGMRSARGLGQAKIDELRRLEGRTFDRLFDYMPCERARSGEIAYLIRAAYTRGIGEPSLDPNWRPQALWVEEPDDEEEEGTGGRFEPYEHDLLRLHNARVRIEPRGLRVTSELGISHQALLVMGALPEEASFPGPDLELLFSPLEIGFPVDAIFTAEFVPNRQAQKLAKKRMVDADQQAMEESHSDHGPSVQTQDKTYSARELQARLGSSDRPPMLRAAITLCVGAGTEEEREERVDRLRHEYGRIELHRPLGEQHRLFVSALHARPFPIPDYKTHLLPEQLGASVPTAISHAGSEIGPYVGYTLSGSRSPIQFDLAEASKQNRPPTVLLTGSLGSGKTMAMQTLEYHALLQGSWPVVDIDPKGGGDHGIAKLAGVADRMETIELGPEERYRGLLDPLRVAEPETREDVAYNFLASILPPPVRPEWQTEIRSAVAEVAAGGRGSTGEIVAELKRKHTPAAGEAARALEVHLMAGLARLGYGEPGVEAPEVGNAQLISLQIRNLTLPTPGISRSEYQEDERIGQAVLNLVAAYALRLCARNRKVHSVLALDEAWALINSQYGLALMSRISRMGRSQNITPLLASQMVGDAEQMEPLVGSYFAFGVETEDEARHSLELLRLDVDDDALQQRLIGFREGRCYFRDFEGRVVPMRIDPGRDLLRELDTTPQREEGTLPRGESAGSDREAEEGEDALVT